MENKEALLILNAIEGLEPRVLMQLLNRVGSPVELLTEGSSLLDGLVGPALAEKIAGWEKYFDLAKELSACKKRQVAWLDWNDERYPESLRYIPQPPPILYYQGRFDKQDAFALAIVGSRQASRYGVEMAKSLGADLAGAGLTVVSGLARGIDTAAHEGALSRDGRTVAIIGSGFANPYPAENVPLLKRIAQTGLVLTEFPLSRAPLPRNFPRRNRIISGLSLGVVVVEAARKSGSLITASHALEQGKSVFAVPGRADSESSQGANSLIQQGAKLVGSAADIVEDLRYLLPKNALRQWTRHQGNPVPAESTSQAPLTSAQKKIFETLELEPVGIEDIIRATKLSAPEVAGGLLVLEMQGLVDQLPGKNFAKRKGLVHA